MLAIIITFIKPLEFGGWWAQGTKVDHQIMLCRRVVLFIVGFLFYMFEESCWSQADLLCQLEMRSFWHWQEREARSICTFNKYLPNVYFVLDIEENKIVTAVTELPKIQERREKLERLRTGSGWEGVLRGRPVGMAQQRRMLREQKC